MFKLDNKLGLGLAALGRPGYITLGHHQNIGDDKSKDNMRVRSGSSAPQAAGVIHTDFEKGFIRAEVVSYDDYVEYGGENGAKEAGRWRLEGKDYVVQDGDVIHFRFNV